MKALLICPSERPAVRHLSAATPLACVPLLGQSLLEYWLSHLANSGIKRVFILAADRPEHVLALVGNGARWGLAAEVIPEARELSPAQAILKYATVLEPASSQANISVLEHLPGGAKPLFTSYADWFEAAHAWMPRAKTPERVGLFEKQPGVWVGLNVRISPGVRLQAPCWLGNNVFVGADSIIGPRVLIEEGALIDPFAEITDSYVGPHTFVGPFTRLCNSIAQANTLIDWPTGAMASVPDPFLLSAVRRPRQGCSISGRWVARLVDLCFRKREEFQVISKRLSMDR